jgi:hypothetical protein
MFWIHIGFLLCSNIKHSQKNRQYKYWLCITVLQYIPDKWTDRLLNGTEQHVLTNVSKEPAASSFKVCHHSEAEKTIYIFTAVKTLLLNSLTDWLPKRLHLIKEHTH